MNSIWKSGGRMTKICKKIIKKQKTEKYSRLTFPTWQCILKAGTKDNIVGTATLNPFPAVGMKT